MPSPIGAQSSITLASHHFPFLDRRRIVARTLTPEIRDAMHVPRRSYLAF
jgi:hypothetical protein